MDVPRPKRILIVDDEPALVDIIVEHLIDSPYEVEAVTNGTDALAAIARERADLVLLDIKMPGLDGLEVLKRIMSTDPSIAVIMVSGIGDIAATADALRHGALAYVPKPFDLRYLKHLVAAGIAG